MVKCEYCGEEKDKRGFAVHLKHCKKNPENIKVVPEIIENPAPEPEMVIKNVEEKIKETVESGQEKLIEAAKKELGVKEKKEEVAQDVSEPAIEPVSESKKDNTGWIIGLVIFMIGALGALVYLIKTGSIPFFNEEQKE